MDGPRIRKVLFLILFIGLFILVAKLFYPFLTVILWSAILYALFYKLHRKASTGKDGLPRGGFAMTLISGGFSLGAVLIIVVPVVFLGWSVLRQVGDLVRYTMRAVESNPALLDLSPQSAIGGFIYRLSDGSIDLTNVHPLWELKRFLSSRSGNIIGFSGTLLKDALGMLLTLAFMVFSLYFFFVDGEDLVHTFVTAIPIDSAYTKLFIRKLRDSGRQLIVGYFLVALFQATMMFGICLAFGVKAPLVIASLTAIASFVPMIGTALVWLPIAVSMIVAGSVAKAIAFVTISAILVATLDNFIRPILLHERLKIHPLLIFFSILGGLTIFGFNGIVLGPLVLILFFSAVEIYETAYVSPSWQTQGRTAKGSGGRDERSAVLRGPRRHPRPLSARSRRGTRRR